jgi:hypothetical protein
MWNRANTRTTVLRAKRRVTAIMCTTAGLRCRSHVIATEADPGARRRLPWRKRRTHAIQRFSVMTPRSSVR